MASIVTVNIKVLWATFIYRSSQNISVIDPLKNICPNMIVIC